MSPLFTLAAFLNFLHKASEAQHRVEVGVWEEKMEGLGLLLWLGFGQQSIREGVFAEEPPKVYKAISFGLLANSRAACVCRTA